VLGAALSLLACSSVSNGQPSNVPAAPVQSGQLAHWPEATTHLRVLFDRDGGRASVDIDDRGSPLAADLGAYWSIASTRGGGSGFFYGSKIARATSVSRIQDISDASAFDYSQPAVGPVPPGGIILVKDDAENRYLAIVLDAIHPVDDPSAAGAGPFAYADIRWYLTSHGSASFAAAP
jgi:hypothetical protein